MNCAGARTDHFDGFRERRVILHDFAELGEMPAVPLAAAHHVVVQLLVEVVE